MNEEDAERRWGKKIGPYKCDRCGEDVWFREKRVSDTNKKIKLGKNGIRIHRCKKNPWMWGKNKAAREFQEQLRQKREPQPQQRNLSDILREQVLREQQQKPQVTIEYLETQNRIGRLEERVDRIEQSLNMLRQLLRSF